MKCKLPSFKHREKKMYVFLGMHLFFLAIIITSASLPATATYWMNEFATTIVNRIVDLFKNTEPVYPSSISVDNYSRNYLTYYYNTDSSKYYIREGEASYFHINLTFPKNAQENLKYKDVSIRQDEVGGEHYGTEFSVEQSRLLIYGKKAKKNNSVTLVTPNNKKVTINFDVVSKVTPERENIYLSNNDAKIGSSFFIDSLYLECYEQSILADGYSINSSLEDYVNGGNFYSNTSRDAFYCPSLSETSSLNYLNLSTHQYISDDPYINIDEEKGIVSILDGVRVGEHTITSNYGGSVTFNVNSEHVQPISISELTIKNTTNYINPGQYSSTYIGQTIELDNLDILKEHAFTVSSSDERYTVADLKRHITNHTFNNTGEIFLRGKNAGESDITVKLYDNEDIKLVHHARCNTMENLFNYSVAIFIDDEIYANQTLETLKKYKLDIKIFDKDTETYLDPVSLNISKYNDRYEISYDELGDSYITFKSEKESAIQFEYVYIGNQRISYKFTFTVVDNNKGIYSNVNVRSVRKIVGHGFMHFMCTLFLLLFLLVYFKGYKFRYLSLSGVAISSFALACFTELLQMLAPGRTPDFQDVIFDYLFSIGCIVLVGLVILIIHLIKRIKNKKNIEE